MSKFAVQIFGSFVVCPSRILRSIKKSEMESLGMLPYLCLPFTSPYLPTDTLETAAIVGVLSVVVLILAMKARPKIVSTIIKAIAVAVINLLNVRKKQAVHIDVWSSRGSIKLTAIPMCSPSPLRQKDKISFINDCQLTFCEWDCAGGHRSILA